MTTQPHPTLADARAWIEDGIADPEGLDAAGVLAFELLGKLDEAVGLLSEAVERAAPLDDFVHYERCGWCEFKTTYDDYDHPLPFVHAKDCIRPRYEAFLQSLKADSREEGR